MSKMATERDSIIERIATSQQETTAKQDTTTDHNTTAKHCTILHKLHTAISLRTLLLFTGIPTFTLASMTGTFILLLKLCPYKPGLFTGLAILLLTLSFLVPAIYMFENELERMQNRMTAAGYHEKSTTGWNMLAIPANWAIVCGAYKWATSDSQMKWAKSGWVSLSMWAVGLFLVITAAVWCSAALSIVCFYECVEQEAVADTKEESGGDVAQG